MVARRLLAALLLSALMHALFFGTKEVRFPMPPAGMVPLEARLAQQPPTAPATRTEPAPAPPRVAERARPSAPAWSAPRVVAATPLALPDAPAADEPGTSAAAEEASQESHATAPPPAPETGSSLAEAGDFSQTRLLPAAGELTYELYVGTDGYIVGRSTYAWTVEDDAYRLVSDSETTGIVELFRPQRLNYTSEGRLTADGLRPVRFTMTRTRRGTTDRASAYLDWDTHQLTFGRPASPRTVALPEASQDIVSFILQLALNPPAPGRIRLPITNGTKFENYELEVFPQESIETPLGSLIALPLKQVRKPGAESIEIWLAVEYRYLPVKVRFNDREGQLSGEQVVSAIRVGEP
jgi:hypothetical protein